MQKRQNGWKPTDEEEFVKVIIACLLVLAGTLAYKAGYSIYKRSHPSAQPAPTSCIGMRLEDFLERIETTCKVDKGAYIWVHSDGKDLIVARIEEK